MTSPLAQPAGRTRLLDRRAVRRLIGMGAVIAVLFALGFGLLVLATSGSYEIAAGSAFGFGTGVLALTLGMRHAFDADHIAAIDNTTRTLMSEGKKPLAVGFFFSLGHSSVVFVVAILLSFGIQALNLQVEDGGSALHAVTGIIGTAVSGVFLYLIAILNLLVTISIIRAFRKLRSGRFDESELESALAKRGLVNRVFGRFGNRIDSSWKMYPLGALFGLGFDTATEISLLVLSGAAVVSGLPWWSMLSLPFLFAAGMCLFDTLDGAFMNVAYGWAFMRPARKVYYNVVITALSVVIALVIGTIEILSLLSDRLGWSGPFWTDVGSIDLNTAGFVVVGALVVTWIVAIAIWKFGRFDTRLDPAGDAA